MTKNKENQPQDNSAGEQSRPDSSQKSNDDNQKLKDQKVIENSSDLNTAKDSNSVDLGKLKKPTTTKAPQASPIAGTARPRVVADKGPKVDWKFSIIGAVSVMFFALTTHIFGINAAFVLNDRFNLSYLFSKSLMEEISRKIPMDMFGIAPLSQPWVKASYISNLGDYGLTFIWYHVINVFWHAVGTGLLFFLVLTLTVHLSHQKRLKLNPYHLSAATAVLFACHPFSCEAVTYLSCRSALLGTINFFQAILFLLLSTMQKHPVAKTGFMLMALFSVCMSVWSNPESIALPAVALLTFFLLKGPLSQWQQSMLKNPFIVGITAALSIAVPCLVMLPLEHTKAINLFLPTLSSISYGASQLKAFVFYYARCFCVPLGLSIDPSLSIAGNYTDPFVLAAAAILVAVLFLLVKLKQPILGWAGILMLAGFLPHGIMLQPDAVADWVAYLPLSGAMLFLAYGICLVGQKDQTKGIVLLGFIAITFCGLSIYRDSQWSSNYSLCQSGISLRPKSAFLHAILSTEYLKREQIDDAEKEAKLAIGYEPNLVLAQIAMAKVDIVKEKFDDASKILASSQDLAKTQKLSPLVRIECDLAELQCLIGKRKENEANTLLTKLTGETQQDGRLLYEVGMASFSLHDYEKAFKLFDKALSVDPSVTESWEPMAKSALYLRAFEPAYQAAHSYVDLIGGTNASLILARAAISSQREGEAEDILKQLTDSDPHNAKALYLMSCLYKHNKKPEQSKKYLQDALKIDSKIAVNYPLPEFEAADAAPAANDASSTQNKLGNQNSDKQKSTDQKPATQNSGTQNPGTQNSSTQDPDSKNTDTQTPDNSKKR